MRHSKGKIKFLPLNREVEIKQETSVLSLALNNKVHIDNSCGGSGSCGTCQIRIGPGSVEPSPRTDVEEEMAKARNFSSDERLACQVDAIDGLEIIVKIQPQEE